MDAEDAPFEAPEKARPDKSVKKTWDRNSSFGRTEIINLAKAPDHFMQEKGKNKGRRIPVNPTFVKISSSTLRSGTRRKRRARKKDAFTGVMSEWRTRWR
jgi:hypothetical protein